MSCLSGRRLAAAASDEDAEAVLHAAACPACADALARERQTREIVAAAPDVRLGAARKAALRADLLAAAETLPVSSRAGGRGRGAAIALAAAAIVVVVLWRGGAEHRTLPDGGTTASATGPVVPAPSTLSTPAAPSTPGPTVGSAAPVPSPPAAPALAVAADILSSSARFERAGDLVQVSEGAMTVDARGRRPTQIVTSDARVVVDEAQVRVAVRGGHLVQVQVFAGSVTVNAAGQKQVIELGELWEPPPPLPIRPAPPRVRVPPTLTLPDDMPDPPAASPRAAVREPAPALRAFRTGWEALRAGRHAEAIAAFDRATDPIVVEDAAYWAAIAAARAGDHREAQRRLRSFLAAFPASPHADEARAALDP